MRSRVLRDTTPGKIHLLSCRTLGSELLMVPKPELNQTVGGILAKYQSEFEVEIFALIFLSNHYHILARGPAGALPKFFESVNRETSHRVNRYLGRSGFFWQRRYDDLVVLEDEDIVEALLYVLTNNVKHALGAHSRHWPGIHSYKQSLGARNQSFPFFHYAAYHAAKKKAERRGEWVRRSDFESMHTLEITPIAELPRLKQFTPARLERLIEQRVKKLLKEHQDAGRSVMSRKAILSQSIQGLFPSNSNKSPRPICYTKSPEALAQYAAERKILRAAYTDASIRFRAGDYSASFPSCTIKPPSHHHPKVLIPQ